MRSSITLLLLVLLPGLTVAAPAPRPTAAARQPDVRIDDVARFYAVYDKARGHPSAAALQSGYLDPGSRGLHQFVKARIGSTRKLADAIAKSPQHYRDARRCVPLLPAVRARLRPVFSRLARLDPQAAFPPVTIVIGRDNTGGTTTAGGVTIGLEVICRSNWLDPDVAQRMVHLIAHEYVHVQQPAAQVDPPADASLLFQSLVEGGAEFIGELTSGDVTNSHLKRWTRGKQCRIERNFKAHALGTDVSAWLYNGPGTPDKPGDLGYWVGYRIVRAYYAHARDKKQAIQDILHVNNSNAPRFLQLSGWQPGDDCLRAARQQSAASVRGTGDPSAALHRYSNRITIFLSINGRHIMSSVTVSPKYQVVIPLAVRKAMGLLPGTKLQVLYFEDRIEMVPVRSSKSLRGSLRGIDTSVPRERDRT